MNKALATIKQRAPGFKPKIAMVLGSGIGDFIKAIEPITTISYAELEGFPATGVAGHAGQLVLGKIGSIELVIMQGRAHFYEHGKADAMAAAIHTFGALGCETMILTNAAGSLLNVVPGSLMMITDHLNFTGVSPLFGLEDNSRFVNMGDAYDEQLRQQLLLAAKQTGVNLHQGVYAWMSGPQFETPAEIKAIRMLGADAVGMSTVPETILARHQQMKVLAVSVITNYGAGMAEGALSHDQTFEFAAKAADDFKQLMTAFIKRY